MKASQPQQQTTPRYSSLQISTTPRGRAIPLVYGTNKINSDLIWAGDFKVTKYVSQTDTSAGGKGGIGGGGGGKGASGQGTVEFYYFSALMGALCEGPIGAFIAARNGSTWVYFDSSLDADCWPVITGNSGNAVVIPAQGFEAYPLLSYLGGGGQLYNAHLPYQLQGADQGLLARYEAQGMIDAQGSVNPNKNDGFEWNGQHFNQISPTAWSSQPLQLSPGYAEQPPPPYLIQNHPDQALSYNGIAYWFSPAYQLGQSATPPSLEFWIAGLLCYDLYGTVTGTPIFDANPADVIYDLITHPVRGLGLSQNFLDLGGTFSASNASYRNFCSAAGMFVSVVLQGQQSASQVIQQLCDQTVSTCWWSEGKLKIAPWFDQAITGYGSTYVPNLTPVYSLNDGHLLDNGSEGGLEITRPSHADAPNQLSLNFQNRALNYSTDTVTIDDLGEQIIHGIRTAPPSSSQYIADQTVAYVSARLQLQKGLYARTTYSFKLPWCFCLLEPMDVIQITDNYAGVVNRPVRIQQINLNQDGTYDVIAQDLPNEIFNLAPYNQQVSGPSGLLVSLPPGSVARPLIFTGPTRITGGDLEVWIAVNGLSEQWGGCRVWTSLDNEHYSAAMTFWGGSRYGSLNGPLPAYSGTEPDLTNPLYVILTGNDSGLPSVSYDLASKGTTLMAILGGNTEMLSYTTSAKTASGRYTLTGLYRGMAGTGAYVHNFADPWVRLDGNVVRIPFDVSMFDQTVYFKFTSFNLVGGLEENLANVAAYPYQIGYGISSPYGPSNLVVGTDGKFLVFTWEADPSPEVVGYEVRMGPSTATWDTSWPLVQGASSTHTVTLLAPPGTWNFTLASYDAYFTYSAFKPSVTFTVPNFYTLSEYTFGPIAHSVDPGQVQLTDWGGPNAGFSGCFVHPTSWMLVPTDTALASFSGDDGGWDWVDNFVTAPQTATSLWTSPVLDSGGTGTSMRAASAAFPYLWSLIGVGASGEVIPFSAFPDWSGWTLSGALVHPTAYAVVPDSTVLANYVPTGGTGWEIFDHFVYSPVSSPTASKVIALGGSFPAQASFSASWAPGAGETAASAAVPLTLSYSNDGTKFKTFSGGFAVASHLKLQVALPVSPCVEYAPQVSGTIVLAPGGTWTPITPWFQDSADNVHWSAWQQIPAKFTTQRYVRFQASWPNSGRPWPVSLESFWAQLDMPTNTQTGTAFVPAAGLTIPYNPAYRQQVTPSVSAISSTAAVPVITAQDLTGFTVQCFYSVTGAPTAATVSWFAIGT